MLGRAEVPVLSGDSVESLHERIKAAAVVGWMCSFTELWPVSAWPKEYSTVLR